jgi:hypothetical protein
MDAERYPTNTVTSTVTEIPRQRTEIIIKQEDRR